MLSKLLRAAALGAAIATSTLAPAFAAASDYRVELASARSAGPGKTDVTVRLVRVRDGAAVRDAVIFQTRADMTPAGMPTMTGSVTSPQAGQQPGTYRFQVDTGMAGGWALTLSARIQGEIEVVRATIAFSAAQ
nr:FixH family protein [uncultured Roseococcus sp.]